MVGVACPMMRDRPRQAWRFVLGLTMGALAAGMMVSLIIYIVGSAVQAFVPQTGRIALLVGICALLGAADLFNRTPHLWRQVPQSLVRQLPPGVLGVSWGFDLGLLFSTQKVASLIWAALAAVLLLEPWAAPAVLGAMAAIFCGVIAVQSLRPGGEHYSHGDHADRVRLRTIRIMSGLTLIVLCVASVT